MGCSWLPDPPVGQRSPTDISAPPVFFADPDDEDLVPVQIDGGVIENDGYRLLNDSDNPQDWENVNEEEETDSNELQFSDAESEHQENATESSSQDGPNDSLSTDNSRRDIVVDFDQVREAMTHITLPPGATPPWAAAIPDSEWCSFIQSRIRSLQEQNSPPTDSKNTN